MFSGFQELLLIGHIILGVVFLPRLSGRRRAPSGNTRENPSIRIHLTGFLRLSIFASLVWLLAAAAYFEPWTQPGHQFFIVGTGPVLAFWGLYWIISGYRKYRK